LVKAKVQKIHNRVIRGGTMDVSKCRLFALPAEYKWFRKLLFGLVVAGLAGCAAAPGMSMHDTAEKTARIPGRQEEILKNLPPIADIDFTLIKQLRQAERTSQANSDNSFEKYRSYRIGVGDVLQITVWDHPELMTALGPQPQTARPADAPSGFVVDEDGSLLFPFAGRLRVVGMSVAQVQSLVATSLVKAFRDPQVTVRIASFRSQRIFVNGEVREPGSQPINDIPMTPIDAISRAGGFASTADQRHVAIIRNGITSTYDLSGSSSGSTYGKQVLEDGDVIRVPTREEYGVFVMGEVTKPITALPMTNGVLTLSQALAQAGSINSNTADAAQLYVIRGSLDKEPTIFHLDATSPVAMVLANEFDLEPNDIVYVDGNGLVRFSRILSLLLPAINAGLTAAIVTK
jgi:polysaccharide export outer membrane protein